MLDMKNRNILDETSEILQIMGKYFRSNISESKGTVIIFNKLKNSLEQIYLRPNNIIDTSFYSQAKIEDALENNGFQFRQELEGKYHFFNDETNTSVYLNPVNKKLSMTP